MTAVRIENDAAVRSLVLCRADEYNTITPERATAGASIDAADVDSSVR